MQASCIDAAGIRLARTALPQQGDRFPLVRQLFDWAEQATELRVFASDIDRTTLITYSVSVPDRLKSVIVLDASSPIRQLVQHDGRMRRAETVVPSLSRFLALEGGLASIKYHSAVQVHFASDGGGRSTLTSSLNSESSPWMLDKLVGLIRSKPEESFLIFTYKSRGGQVDFPRRILQALVDAGIDPDASVPTGISEAPTVMRVAVSTWGRETGTNEFSAYQNIVLLGVMRKPEEALAGVYLGQVDDLRCPRMQTLVKQLGDSECHHSIYQAINRGRMRRVQVVDGLTQAAPCHVYIWHRDAQLESKLAPVLPACLPWIPWREPEETSRASDVAMRIRAYLTMLDAGGETNISCRALRKAMGAVGDSTFRRAREMALNESHWTLVKSTLTKVQFPVIA